MASLKQRILISQIFVEAVLHVSRQARYLLKIHPLGALGCLHEAQKLSHIFLRLIVSKELHRSRLRKD